MIELSPDVGEVTLTMSTTLTHTLTGVSSWVFDFSLEGVITVYSLPRHLLDCSQLPVLWMSVSPQNSCGDLIPNATDLRNGPLEGDQVGHEGPPLKSEMRAFVKGASAGFRPCWLSVSSIAWRHIVTWGHGIRPLWRTSHSKHHPGSRENSSQIQNLVPWSWTSSLQHVKNKFLLFTGYPVGGILFSQHEWNPICISQGYFPKGHF